MEKQEFILQCIGTETRPIPRFGPILEHKHEVRLVGHKDIDKDWPVINDFWIYVNPPLECGKKYKLTIEEHNES